MQGEFASGILLSRAMGLVELSVPVDSAGTIKVGTQPTLLYHNSTERPDQWLKSPLHLGHSSVTLHLETILIEEDTQSSCLTSKE